MAVAELQIHSAAELFPILSGDALDELAKDIKANGLRERVKLLDGKVIDGRCRLAAMRKARITPTDEHFETITLPEGENPYGYVMSLNLHRRHLPNGLRVTLAARAAEAMKIERQLAKADDGKLSDNQLARTFADAGAIVTGKASAPVKKQGRVNEIMAEVFAVSPAQVARAQKLLKEDPELFQRVQEGKETPGGAHSKLSGNGSTRDDSGKRFVAKLDALGEQLGADKVKLSKVERRKALAAAEAIVARLSEDAQV